MKIYRYLIGASVVGLISVFYSLMIFSLFDFYPDLHFGLSFLEENIFLFYLFVFLKNFIVGLILMYLFNLAYGNILRDKNDYHGVLGVLFFCFYAIFAVFAFSIGDLFLVRSEEGIILLLTIDGVIETIIATIPIRFFSRKDLRF